VPSTQLTFATAAAHQAWLETQAPLPQGFRTATTRFEFNPEETPTKTAKMAMTLIALDSPTDRFGALFTRNAFPGAPVLIGRRRREEKTLGAIIINNKVSNVCAPGGEAASEAICAETAKALGLRSEQILPCSTGVIGWQLPVPSMVRAIPALAKNLEAGSSLPAARAIMTTDLYPKLRRVRVGDGSIVGMAKGAGMIEPNLATLLVFVLTDLDVSRDFLRSALVRAVDPTFGCMTVDTDTSTSDTVALLSSARVKCQEAEFEKALTSPKTSSATGKGSTTSSAFTCAEHRRKKSRAAWARPSSARRWCNVPSAETTPTWGGW
jgi:glutamate N-acetyltransferase/amino-acid N-acetyltransferase